MEKNYLILSLRGVSIGLLLILLILVGNIFNPTIFNVFEIMSIAGYLRDVFAFLLYIILFGLFYGVYMVIGGIMRVFGGAFSVGYFQTLCESTFQNMVGNWFYLPDYFSSPTANGSTNLVAPTMGQAWNGLKSLFSILTGDFYLVFLQLMMLFMFIYAIRGALTSNPSDSIRVIMLLNVVIVIPLFFLQIRDVLSIFGIVNLPNFLNNLVVTSSGLILPDIMVDIRELSFFGFLTTTIFWVALIMFLYLEFTFQLSYVEKVTTPSVEREIRLSRQIDLMHIEAEKAIARIKAVEDMKRQKKAEERLKKAEEEKELGKSDKNRFALNKFMSEKASNVGFSLITELIAKKKAEKQEQVIMDAMKDTRKVANYLDKLFKQDKEAKDTLTAKTAAPKASRLIYSTIINMTTRILMITLLAWAVVHPYDVYSLFQSPDSIQNSVELQTVEGILSVLLPFILIIPLISNIIKVTKHNKLKEMLRLEELRRKGLTEEELTALEISRGGVTQEEVLMAQDQDAAADRARKMQI